MYSTTKHNNFSTEYRKFLNTLQFLRYKWHIWNKKNKLGQNIDIFLDYKKNLQQFLLWNSLRISFIGKVLKYDIPLNPFKRNSKSIRKRRISLFHALFCFFSLFLTRPSCPAHIRACSPFNRISHLHVTLDVGECDLLFLFVKSREGRDFTNRSAFRNCPARRFIPRT